MNNSINLVLQGKGGVGKSFISSMLAQYFLDYKKFDLVGADTDPVNKSFASFERINAYPIEILKNGAIIQSKFDNIFELMVNEENKTFVIDNGASTFVPMMKYIEDNGVIDLFDELDRPVFIHTVIVGGQSQSDTLQGLASLYELVKNSKNVKLIIWLNEFQGDVEISNTQKKVVADKTAGVIKVVNRDSDAFTADLEKMTKSRLTLVEALQDSNFGLMAKNRLKRVFNDIYEQLDPIFNESQSTAE